MIENGRASPAESPLPRTILDHRAVYKLLEQVLGDNSIYLLSKRYITAAFKL